ncbi:MAG: phosphatidylinositol dimannoside acyltransferase [Acidimicrobiaceae bacterium]|nr:phosphatidylinositol dimannoside acyltransferase [Acidimicrobiaceae bacterium]
MFDRTRRLAPYWGYRTAASLARALPAPVSAIGGDALVVAMAPALWSRRRMIERHLRRASGGTLEGWALRRAAGRAIQSYVRYWIESFRLSEMTPAELDAGMDYEGLELLDAALAEGRGVILALPHLGGWDFGGAWFASQGYQATVVVEPLDPPELFEWFADMRRAIGLEVVPLGPDAGTAVLRRLKQGGIVGLVCDRDLPGTGVEVEFFGERTTLPSGPATLALRTGAPLLPVAVYFEGRHGHRGVVRPPIDVARAGGFRDDVARVTQALAHELEDLIRRDPSQWHMFQPNWPSDRAEPAR